MAYSDIKDPSAHFQTALYAGNNTTDHNITNDGNSDLQPDLVWIKVRNNDNPHVLHDTTRGFAGNGEVNLLQSASSAAEATNGGFESFNTNGFGVGGTNVASGSYNLSGKNYVAWQWKANGGTTASNTDGTLTGGATVQANTDAGFSIITYTGTSQTNPTVGHGLNQAPELVIVKNRDLARNWAVGSTAVGWTKYLALDTTGAAVTNSGWWGNQDPTSTTVGLGTGTQTAGNTYDYVMYAFHSVQGYSKFGKYVGNGNANGTFIYTGFKPAFVLVKNASAAESWVVYDTARDTFNLTNLKLSPDTADMENNNSGIGGPGYNDIDILSNGFKCRTNNAATNGSGNTIIYMAFAENPFVAGGIPTTAR